MTNQEYIEKALNKDVDLSSEEYRKKCTAADLFTATHGVEGKAPISEAVRHKRIQSNFYGTALNVMLSLLAELSQTNELLREFIKFEFAKMTPEEAARYGATEKRGE